MQPHKQHASNTNLAIVCVYCKKHRVVYSKNKVSKNVATKFKGETLERQFMCGTTIEKLFTSLKNSSLEMLQFSHLT